MRKIIFWTHLIAGTVAAVVVLIMSVTGVALTYERQMMEWADRHYRSTPPAPGATPMPVSEVLASVHASHGFVPSTVTIGPDATDPIQLAAGRESVLFVDAYSGQVLGEGSRGIRAFCQKMTSWHRWLGQEGEGRAVGRAITGACNLAFLFLVVTGAYLWLPRKWNWQQMKAVLLFRGGLSGKARDFNWHNVVGIWSVVPLFVVVLSGVVISYPWAGNLVYTLTGTEPPRGGGGPPRGGPPRGGEARPVRIPGLDAAVQNARAEMQDWRTITVRVPPSPRAPLTLSVDKSHRGRPDQRLQLTADTTAGAITARESFADYNAGRRTRSWLRWLHTGEALGFIGQTIAGLVSAGAVVLVWTGLALTWRRWQAWRSRTQRQAVPARRAA